MECNAEIKNLTADMILNTVLQTLNKEIVTKRGKYTEISEHENRNNEI